MKRNPIRTAVVAALAMSAIALPGAAHAAPPSNNNFANATIIDPSSLSYTNSVTIDEATSEPGDGHGCGYYGISQTVWYAFTPNTTGVLRVVPTGSAGYQFAGVYSQPGSGPSDLSLLGCSDWAFGSVALVPVQSGTTYYLEAGTEFFQTGTLGVSMQLTPPPGNDDFANAKAVGSLPFSDSVDATAATIEANEPAPACGYGQSTGSVWYAFTPTVSASYTVSSPYSGLSTEIAANTGSGLGSLSQLGCRLFGNLLTFRADAGTTYYVQLGALFGGRGQLNVSFDVAPNPVAGFGFNPSDPSIFDTIGFSDSSSDPAQVGVQSWLWAFGDGASSAEQYPQHRYAADGDYSVKLTVTTTDGRTASTTQVIHVKTHDVAIGLFSVPTKGRAGKTGAISVGIINTRYPETVQVQLFVSTPSGFQLVGTLTQTIPVKGKKKTTPFSFNYTFTSADAVVGKVNFQAVATIVGARDALPTDNTAISIPTRVNP